MHKLSVLPSICPFVRSSIRPCDLRSYGPAPTEKANRMAHIRIYRTEICDGKLIIFVALVCKSKMETNRVPPAGYSGVQDHRVGVPPTGEGPPTSLGEFK